MFFPKHPSLLTLLTFVLYVFFIRRVHGVINMGDVPSYASFPFNLPSLLLCLLFCLLCLHGSFCIRRVTRVT